MKRGHDQPRLEIEDPDGQLLRVVWSRSGKRVGLSIEKHGGVAGYLQMELTPEQVGQLVEFLKQTTPL